MILWHPLSKFPYNDLGTGNVVHPRHFFPNMINECCEGCQRAENGRCTAYVDTIVIWNSRDCPLATHTKREAVVKQKVNPLKASKKAKKKVV